MLSGVVHEGEGVSINDERGIKYCPGDELPRYQYVEYKPRCSKTRSTTFVYRQDKTMPEVQLEQEMAVSTQPEQDVTKVIVHEPEERKKLSTFVYMQDKTMPEVQLEQEMDVSTYPEQDMAKLIMHEPEEGRDLSKTEAHLLSVKERVEEWDRLNTVEEVGEPTKEMVNKTRRSSDRFMRLAENFERSGLGLEGEGELSELSRKNIEMADSKSQNLPKFNNFSDILAKFRQGRGKSCKFPTLRQQKL